tara:strand:+ start:1494 stop:3047 length:1554 start_codon:yes stop_codon:yes gene_type:complete
MTKKKLQCFTKKDNAKKPYVYCIDGKTKKNPRTLITKKKRVVKDYIKGDGNILSKIRGFRSLSQPTIKPVVSSFRSLSKTGDGNILPKIRGFRKLSQPTIKPVVAALKKTADWTFLEHWSVAKSNFITNDKLKELGYYGSEFARRRWEARPFGGDRDKEFQEAIKSYGASRQLGSFDHSYWKYGDYGMDGGPQKLLENWGYNIGKLSPETIASILDPPPFEFQGWDHSNQRWGSRDEATLILPEGSTLTKKEIASIGLRIRMRSSFDKFKREGKEWTDEREAFMRYRIAERDMPRQREERRKKEAREASRRAERAEEEAQEKKRDDFDEWMAQGESDSDNEELYEEHSNHSPNGRREEEQLVMDDEDGHKEKPRSMAERTRVVAKMKESVRRHPLGDIFFTNLDNGDEPDHELVKMDIPTYSSPAMLKRFKKNYDRLNPYGELLSLKRDGSKKQGYPYPIGESWETKRIRHNEAVEGAMEAVDNFKRKAGSGGANKKPEGTNAQDRRAQLAEWYGRG